MNAQILSGTERHNLLSSLNIPLPSSSSLHTSRTDEDGGADVENKMKNRLMSMWNNVKYGMKLKTNFSKESPVFLLGECYHRKSDNPLAIENGIDAAAQRSEENLVSSPEDDLESFKADFESRIWMTYRREFPILNGSTYSSDCGWGCMLRSGQMLLAQALVCHLLGREWRYYGRNTNHRNIIKLFGDKQNELSPLSIHALVNIGKISGKKAGDWYGPGAVAHILKQAIKDATQVPELDNLAICVAQDCAVYWRDIVEECSTPDGRWKSLVLLVPVRLGAEKFNPVYAPALTNLFSLPQCIGIIGGRPKHSLYFVGYQDDKLIHLDPHYCQEMIDVWVDDFPVTTFHCRSPRKLHLSKLDPSCCLGFYCKTEKNLIELKLNITENMSKSQSGMDYPMFTFCDGHSRDSRLSPPHRMPPDVEYSIEGAEDYMESEEFVLI